jgi:hypothetical protein
MVAERNATPPTREQILFGLRECLSKTACRELVFDVNTPVMPLLEASELVDDICMDFILPIDFYFENNLSIKDWAKFFEESPNSNDVTFGDVADFIAEKLPAVSLEPAVVLGKTCQPAGAFLGLEQLARHVQPKLPAVGPSTPIRNCLQGGKLQAFCNHLHWVSCGLIERPQEILAPKTLRRRLLELSVVVLAAVLIIGCLMAFHDFGPQALGRLEVWFGIWFGSLAVVCFYWAGVFCFARWISSPLPPGVETFRDLAKLIAYRMEAKETT